MSANSINVRAVDAPADRPRASVRARQRAGTRRRLLDAATAVFARDGLVGARTSDVAAEAGVSHGTVFVHVPTRDDLLAAAVGELGERVAERTHALAQGEGTVRDVLATHLAGLRTDEDFYRRLVAESPVLGPVARSTLVGVQSAIAFHFAAAAEREMAEGRMRRLPLPLLFNTWLGLVHHYLVNRELFAPGGSVLDRHGTELLDHYLALVAA